MLLYTLQSIETICKLNQDRVFFAHFGQRPPVVTEGWKILLEHYILKYNRIKEHDYSSAPILWYVDKVVALQHLNMDVTGACLIKASVPDAIVLTPEYITPYIDLYWIVEKVIDPATVDYSTE